MIRMDGNKRYSETNTISVVLESLTKRLPSSWTTITELEPIREGWRRRADAVVLLQGPDGVTVRLAIEAKREVEPRTVGQVVDSFRDFEGAVPLVVAPYLSLRTRELLKARGCGFADTTGNVWLSIPRPAVFIETIGATKSPIRIERPL